MKRFLDKLVVWDWIVVLLLLNSIFTLIANIYYEDLTNNDVVASMGHCLFIMYSFTYYKKRKII